MSKPAVLTPRVALVFLVLFVATVVIASFLFDNWSDFKAGFREGYSAGSSQPSRH